MTVSSVQIIAAQAKGLINVVPLAKACDALKFPFYLAATIMQRETGGQNIFGHDAGGAYSVPNKDIQVTEARYKDFLKQIGAGKTSNGVGPMQLTYRGYHIGPVSMQARGFKAWLPADNILYGVEILAKSLKTQLAAGLSLAKAFWNVAKIYNAGKLEGPAGTNYANGAAASARTWAATVGTSDMDPTPPPEDDMPTAKEIADELVPRLSKAIVEELFADNRIKAGADEKDATNAFWRLPTFVTADHDVLVEIRDLLKK